MHPIDPNHASPLSTKRWLVFRSLTILLVACEFLTLSTSTTFAQIGGTPVPPINGLPPQPYTPPPYTPPVGQPPATYGQPPATYGQPPATYGQPPATYGQPPATYGQPPSPFGAPQPPLAPGLMNQPMPPLNQPWQVDPALGFTGAPPFGYNPAVRDVPIDVYVSEGQTGKFSVGGSVNSDLGVAGQLIIEERNFDLFRLPGRPSDMFNGAFRGAGQNFRVELVPGNQVQRYTVNWTEPNLFGYSPFNNL